MPETYIKLFRKFINWEWYSHEHTKTVFIHLLLKANYKEKSWQGLIIKRGQVVTSLRNIASETNLSVQNVRTALANMLSTHEITQESTHNYTVITLIKYDHYQGEDDTANTVTNKPTTQKLTTTKEYKNSIIKNNTNIMSSKIVKEVIEYMNELANTTFKPSTNNTVKLINARLNEGFTKEELKDVVYYKYEEWYKEPKKFSNGIMSDYYFRPSTLFSGKFEEYLDQYRRDENYSD